jgi:quinolinate synthase
MAMNTLESLYHTLLTGANRIVVDKELAALAMIPLQRMLDFSTRNKLQIRGKA